MELDSYKLQSSYRGLGRMRMLVATLFGLFLLNPPLLEIFSSNRTVTLFGWPLLLVYIFAVWLLLILLVVWPTPRRPAATPQPRETEQQSSE